MTSDELKQWINYHDAIFPGFKGWYVAADSPELLQVRMRMWAGRLAPYSLRQAEAQTEAMFIAREKPKFFSDHLDWIMARLSPRPLLNGTVRSGSYESRCELCNGSGMVSVVFFEPRFTPDGQPLPGNRGPAACMCNKGIWLNNRRADHQEGTQLQPYDARKMQPDLPEELTADEVAECRQRLGDSNPSWLAAVDRLSRRMRTTQRRIGN